jgi:hypothetical protein
LQSKNIKFKIFRIIILPVALYGCGTLSLTKWEKYKQRVFKNKELRKVIGPKRERLTDDWRELNMEELYVL